MKKHGITFLVFTFNEEKRLDYIMRCIKGHGDIVVIDNFSGDHTCELAKQYTEKVYQHKNPGYVENEETMTFALSKVETEWVYLTYVDEFIPADLMGILHRITRENKYKIVEIYRKNFMYGREIHNYGKHHLRMFTRDAVSFDGNIVHKLGKRLVPAKAVYQVPVSDRTSIWHFSPYNSSRLELVHNRYADLEAKQRHEIAGQRFSGFRALWKLIFYFFGTYLGLGGFRGGWPGLFISIEIAYFKFSIEARLWEYDNGVSVERMENEYRELKERLLRNDI